MLFTRASRTGSFWLSALFLAVSFGVHVSPVYAQSATGEISGTVVDNTGGAVPSATVKLTNEATHVVDQRQTNQSGYYVFINVQPGTYDLSVESPGFKTAQIPAFELAVNQTMTQNVKLSLGEVNQTVEVTSSAPLLQTSSSNLGTVISPQAVKALPLNGRNFTQLMILTPGANPVSTAQGSGISFQDAGVTGIPGTQFYKPSMQGQDNRSTMFFLDGIINTDIRGSIYGFLPIVDAVQEFKVQSHNDKAEYGDVLGGTVNLLSKSGTDQYHGSAWEFVRNNVFDARNPFTDFCNAARCAPGTPSTTPASPVPYHQNEFGVAGGGPIIKNKTFFYAAYEGWRYSKAPLTLSLVPTQQELSGDFSQSYYNHKIYNPFSTQCANGKCTQSAFAGNVIPSQYMSPVMQKYLGSYLAAPNLTGVNGYNYVETRPETNTNNSWQIRLDHAFNEKNNMFLRLSQQWVKNVAPVSGTTETTPSTSHAYDFGGGYDHIFSPSLILDIRAGALMKPYLFNQANAAAGTAPATAAGFQNVEQYGGMVVDLAGPYITSDIGQRGWSPRGNPAVNYEASLNWIKGNHNIKFGQGFLYVNRFQTNLYQSFGFSDAQTSYLGQANTGNSLASALLGTLASYTGQLPRYAEDYFRFNVWSGYVQDEWKVRPNLTVNIGLRYDYLPKVVMLDNRPLNGLNLFSQQYIIGRSSVGACTTPFADPCIPGGMSSVPYNNHIVFAGNQSVVPPSVGDNWGPRVGIAWQIRPSTVLRAGYGIFYDTVSARSQYAQNDIEGATWPWTIGINAQQANNAVNGIWAGGAGNPLTLITNLEGNFPNPVVQPSPWTTNGGGYTNSPDYKNPRSQQYNLDLEQQLGRNMMLSLAYVGSRDTRLDYTGYANAAPHANPVGTPKTTIDQEKLMPFMVPTWHYSQSIGISDFNAFELEFQRHFSKGLLTLLSYTWSKSLDDTSGWFGAENGTGGSAVIQSYFNPMSNYGQSAFNIPQILTWSTVYDLPFGKGQRFLNHGPLSWVFGNWEANYVFMARSGQPFTLNVSGDIANISGDGGTLSGYGRPNLVGDPNAPCNIKGVLVKAGSEACYYNPTAFEIPKGSFGNLGRDVFRQPSFFNMDFSLVKTIPFGEQRSIQLRFESFNTLNFQILAAPGVTIGNANAGVVNNISSTPREMQMGAKITF